MTRAALVGLVRVIRGNPRKAFVLLLSLLFTFIYKRIKAAQIRDAGRKKSVDSRPLLAFGGSFLLLSYYNGIAGYLKDHFQLDNVRFSGVSGGCIGYLPILMGMPVDKTFALGMYVRQKLFERRLLCYLLGESECISMFMQEMKVMGLTDKKVKDICKQNRCFFGVTVCKWLGGLIPVPDALVVPLGDTMEAAMKQVLSSMCVLPFFRNPGKLADGRYVIDGAMAMMYAIPEDAHKDKIIRISPWKWFVPADVKPMSWHRMHCFDVLVPVGAKLQIDQFCVGYQTAWDHHHVFVEKGIKPKPYSTNPKKRLKEHLASFQTSAILRPQERTKPKPTSTKTNPQSDSSPSPSDDDNTKSLEGTRRSRVAPLYRPSSETKIEQMLVEEGLFLEDQLSFKKNRARSGSIGFFNIDAGKGSTDSLTAAGDSDFKCTMEHANSIWRRSMFLFERQTCTSTTTTKVVNEVTEININNPVPKAPRNKS